MPAAWLVREEKPALYHWVPRNFSGPRSKQTDVVQAGQRVQPPKVPKFWMLALLRLFRCLTNLKTAHFWNSFTSSNETYERHAAYTFIQPSQSQKKDLMCRNHPAHPPELPSTWSPSCWAHKSTTSTASTAKASHATSRGLTWTHGGWLVEIWSFHNGLSTQSQRITHEFLHCTCACVYTKTFLSDSIHFLKTIDGMSLTNLQTLFCQDATGFRRLHGRYPPADYCKSQVLEILPTTGLCSSKWSFASMFFSVACHCHGRWVYGYTEGPMFEGVGKLTPRKQLINSSSTWGCCAEDLGNTVTHNDIKLLCNAAAKVFPCASSKCRLACYGCLAKKVGHHPSSQGGAHSAT